MDRILVNNDGTSCVDDGRSALTNPAAQSARRQQRSTEHGPPKQEHLNLNDGTLLNDEEQEIYSGIYEYGHTGLLPGYMSIARYHKDIDSIVIQFVNTSGGNSWGKSEIIYKRIVNILRRKS